MGIGSRNHIRQTSIHTSLGTGYGQNGDRYAGDTIVNTHQNRFQASPVGTLALLSLCLHGTLVLAAGGNSGSGGGREAFFRCKDAQGQTHFGDSMPAECQSFDTEVLSQNGNVIRVIDGASTLARKAANQGNEIAEQKAREAAALRDRMLIEAYLTVGEIESLRDQRLDLLDAQTRLDEQNLAAFKDREQRLVRQLERFRPYNDKQPKALPVPDHLAEDMVNLVKSRDTTAERIERRKAERQTLTEKFASDVQRFKELKGIK